MHYRRVGNSGLKVSVVGVGCNNFGRSVNSDETSLVVNSAIDHGINFFDTADVYGEQGKSEEFLGKALQGKRYEVVIATKFGGQMSDNNLHSGGSRRWIMQAVDNSLRRLNTDYIDLYQIHRYDPNVPIDETLHALDDLVSSGKVRYIGCSNFSSWQICDSHWTSKTDNISHFISAQNQYSLLGRKIEEEIIPAAERYGLGILPYFPLASGMLTGKYRRGQTPPEGSRLSWIQQGDRMLSNDRFFDVIEQLEEFAQERNHSILELAFSWLASNPQVSSIIAGATKPEQVQLNANAINWVLTEDDIAEVNKITS